MSYLQEITPSEVVEALRQLTEAPNRKLKGRIWTVKYHNKLFSPNEVIRKIGEIKGKTNPKDFQGGDGKYGCITFLKSLDIKGLEIIGK